MNAEAPSRPVLRWFGGKWRLAPWILEHLPRSRVYVEPYGGAASVLLRKERCYSEVYNDLDDEVVTLFRVLQDPAGSARLREKLYLTAFSRTEFRAAYEMSSDPVIRAYRLIVRCYLGFGANAHASNAKGHRSTGFRANSNRSGTTPAHDWANYPDILPKIIERLRGVVIENRPALDIMEAHDGPDTCFYLDPPYIQDLRAPGNHYDMKWRMYRHELSREDHVVLLGFLRSLKGMVVISGYPDASYDTFLGGWERIERKAYADGARKRTEVLWSNPAAVAARDGGLLSRRAG